MTGNVGWFWGLVEATSMQVIAPAAQLNAVVVVAAGGRVKGFSVDVGIGVGAKGNFDFA